MIDMIYSTGASESTEAVKALIETVEAYLASKGRRDWTLCFEIVAGKSRRMRFTVGEIAENMLAAAEVLVANPRPWTGIIRVVAKDAKVISIEAKREHEHPTRL